MGYPLFILLIRQDRLWLASLLVSFDNLLVQTFNS